MTYILPIITSVSLLLAMNPLAVGEEAVPKVAGNALVGAAIESLLQQPDLEAKIRQRATIFGQLLSGAGLYAQTRDANRLLVRFEFKIQVADKSMALLQINDGSTLWIRRDIDQLQSQAYVDLRRLRDALSRDPASEARGIALSNQSLAVGGLAQLLRAFSDHFEFGNATATEISNVPMWELTGEWKKERLLLLLPNQRAQIDAGQSVDVTQLPPHLPTNIKLTLGRDRNFPLFPYRIEYGRVQPASTTTATVSGKPAARIVRPMVTMELFEVRRRHGLPRDLFTYSPGDPNVEDQTETYLRQYRLLQPTE